MTKDTIIMSRPQWQESAGANQRLQDTEGDSDSTELSYRLRMCNGFSHENISSLINMMEEFIKNPTLKKLSAKSLKRCLPDAIMTFYMYYRGLGELLDNSSYLEKMTELLAMYTDVEARCWYVRNNHTTELVSLKDAYEVSSRLHTFYGTVLHNKLDQKLFLLMKCRLIKKEFKTVFNLIFEKILLKSDRPSITNEVDYIRYILAYKLWKKLFKLISERKHINELAVKNIENPELLCKLNNLNNLNNKISYILPTCPRNSKNITLFYMLHKFNVDKACVDYFVCLKNGFGQVNYDKMCSFTEDDTDYENLIFTNSVGDPFDRTCFSTLSTSTSASTFRTLTFNSRDTCQTSSTVRRKTSSSSDIPFSPGLPLGPIVIDDDDNTIDLTSEEVPSNKRLQSKKVISTKLKKHSVKSKKKRNNTIKNTSNIYANDIIDLDSDVEDIEEDKSHPFSRLSKDKCASIPESTQPVVHNKQSIECLEDSSSGIESILSENDHYDPFKLPQAFRRLYDEYGVDQDLYSVFDEIRFSKVSTRIETDSEDETDQSESVSSFSGSLQGLKESNSVTKYNNSQASSLPVSKSKSITPVHELSQASQKQLGKEAETDGTLCLNNSKCPANGFIATSTVIDLTDDLTRIADKTINNIGTPTKTNRALHDIHEIGSEVSSVTTEDNLITSEDSMALDAMAAENFRPSDLVDYSIGTPASEMDDLEEDVGTPFTSYINDDVFAESRDASVILLTSDESTTFSYDLRSEAGTPTTETYIAPVKSTNLLQNFKEILAKSKNEISNENIQPLTILNSVTERLSKSPTELLENVSVENTTNVVESIPVSLATTETYKSLSFPTFKQVESSIDVVPTSSEAVAAHSALPTPENLREVTPEPSEKLTDSAKEYLVNYSLMELEIERELTSVSASEDIEQVKTQAITDTESSNKPKNAEHISQDVMPLDLDTEIPTRKDLQSVSENLVNYSLMELEIERELTSVSASEEVKTITDLNAESSKRKVLNNDESVNNEMPEESGLFLDCGTDQEENNIVHHKSDTTLSDELEDTLEFATSTSIKSLENLEIAEEDFEPTMSVNASEISISNEDNKGHFISSEEVIDVHKDLRGFEEDMESEIEVSQNLSETSCAIISLENLSETSQKNIVEAEASILSTVSNMDVTEELETLSDSAEEVEPQFKGESSIAIPREEGTNIEAENTVEHKEELVVTESESLCESNEQPACDVELETESQAQEFPTVISQDIESARNIETAATELLESSVPSENQSDEKLDQSVPIPTDNEEETAIAEDQINVVAPDCTPVITIENSHNINDILEDTPLEETTPKIKAQSEELNKLIVHSEEDISKYSSSKNIEQNEPVTIFSKLQTPLIIQRQEEEFHYVEDVSEETLSEQLDNNGNNLFQVVNSDAVSQPEESISETFEADEIIVAETQVVHSDCVLLTEEVENIEVTCPKETVIHGDEYSLIDTELVIEEEAEGHVTKPADNVLSSDKEIVITSDEINGSNANEYASIENNLEIEVEPEINDSKVADSILPSEQEVNDFISEETAASVVNEYPSIENELVIEVEAEIIDSKAADSILPSEQEVNDFISEETAASVVNEYPSIESELSIGLEAEIIDSKAVDTASPSEKENNEIISEESTSSEENECPSKENELIIEAEPEVNDLKPGDTILPSEQENIVIISEEITVTVENEISLTHIESESESPQLETIASKAQFLQSDSVLPTEQENIEITPEEIIIESIENKLVNEVEADVIDSKASDSVLPSEQSTLVSDVNDISLIENELVRVEDSGLSHERILPIEQTTIEITSEEITVSDTNESSITDIEPEIELELEAVAQAVVLHSDSVLQNEQENIEVTPKEITVVKNESVLVFSDPSELQEVSCVELSQEINKINNKLPTFIASNVSLINDCKSTDNISEKTASTETKFQELNLAERIPMESSNLKESDSKQFSDTENESTDENINMVNVQQESSSIKTVEEASVEIIKEKNDYLEELEYNEQQTSINKEISEADVKDKEIISENNVPDESVLSAMEISLTTETQSMSIKAIEENRSEGAKEEFDEQVQLNQNIETDTESKIFEEEIDQQKSPCDSNIDYLPTVIEIEENLLIEQMENHVKSTGVVKPEDSLREIEDVPKLIEKVGSPESVDSAIELTVANEQGVLDFNNKNVDLEVPSTGIESSNNVKCNLIEDINIFEKHPDETLVEHDNVTCQILEEPNVEKENLNMSNETAEVIENVVDIPIIEPNISLKNQDSVIKMDEKECEEISTGVIDADGTDINSGLDVSGSISKGSAIINENMETSNKNISESNLPSSVQIIESNPVNDMTLFYDIELISLLQPNNYKNESSKPDYTLIVGESENITFDTKISSTYTECNSLIHSPIIVEDKDVSTQIKEDTDSSKITVVPEGSVPDFKRLASSTDLRIDLDNVQDESITTTLENVRLPSSPFGSSNIGCDKKVIDDIESKVYPENSIVSSEIEEILLEQKISIIESNTDNDLNPVLDMPLEHRIDNVETSSSNIVKLVESKTNVLNTDKLCLDESKIITSNNKFDSKIGLLTLCEAVSNLHSDNINALEDLKIERPDSIDNKKEIKIGKTKSLYNKINKRKRKRGKKRFTRVKNNNATNKKCNYKSKEDDVMQVTESKSKETQVLLVKMTKLEDSVQNKTTKTNQVKSNLLSADLDILCKKVLLDVRKNKKRGRKPSKKLTAVLQNSNINPEPITVSKSSDKSTTEEPIVATKQKLGIQSKKLEKKRTEKESKKGAKRVIEKVEAIGKVTTRRKSFINYNEELTFQETFNPRRATRSQTDKPRNKNNKKSTNLDIVKQMDLSFSEDSVDSIPISTRMEIENRKKEIKTIEPLKKNVDGFLDSLNKSESADILSYFCLQPKPSAGIPSDISVVDPAQNKPELLAKKSIDLADEPAKKIDESDDIVERKIPDDNLLCKVESSPNKITSKDGSEKKELVVEKEVKPVKLKNKILKQNLETKNHCTKMKNVKSIIHPLETQIVEEKPEVTISCVKDKVEEKCVNTFEPISKIDITVTPIAEVEVTHWPQSNLDLLAMASLQRREKELATQGLKETSKLSKSIERIYQQRSPDKIKLVSEKTQSINISDEVSITPIINQTIKSEKQRKKIPVKKPYSLRSSKLSLPMSIVDESKPSDKKRKRSKIREEQSTNILNDDIEVAVLPPKKKLKLISSERRKSTSIVKDTIVESTHKFLQSQIKACTDAPIRNWDRFAVACEIAEQVSKSRREIPLNELPRSLPDIVNSQLQLLCKQIENNEEILNKSSKNLTKLSTNDSKLSGVVNVGEYISNRSDLDELKDDEDELIIDIEAKSPPQTLDAPKSRHIEEIVSKLHKRKEVDSIKSITAPLTEPPVIIPPVLNLIQTEIKPASVEITKSETCNEKIKHLDSAQLVTEIKPNCSNAENLPEFKTVNNNVTNMLKMNKSSILIVSPIKISSAAPNVEVATKKDSEITSNNRQPFDRNANQTIGIVVLPKDTLNSIPKDNSIITPHSVDNSVVNNLKSIHQGQECNDLKIKTNNTETTKTSSLDQVLINFPKFKKKVQLNFMIVPKTKFVNNSEKFKSSHANVDNLRTELNKVICKKQLLDEIVDKSKPEESVSSAVSENKNKSNTIKLSPAVEGPSKIICVPPHVIKKKKMVENVNENLPLVHTTEIVTSDPVDSKSLDKIIKKDLISSVKSVSKDVMLELSANDEEKINKEIVHEVPAIKEDEPLPIIKSNDSIDKPEIVVIEAIPKNDKQICNESPKKESFELPNQSVSPLCVKRDVVPKTYDHVIKQKIMSTLNSQEIQQDFSCTKKDDLQLSIPKPRDELEVLDLTVTKSNELNVTLSIDNIQSKDTSNILDKCPVKLQSEMPDVMGTTTKSDVEISDTSMYEAISPSNGRDFCSDNENDELLNTKLETNAEEKQLSSYAADKKLENEDAVSLLEDKEQSQIMNNATETDNCNDSLVEVFVPVSSPHSVPTINETSLDEMDLFPTSNKIVSSSESINLQPPSLKSADSSDVINNQNQHVIDKSISGPLTSVVKPVDEYPKSKKQCASTLIEHMGIKHKIFVIPKKPIQHNQVKAKPITISNVAEATNLKKRNALESNNVDDSKIQLAPANKKIKTDEIPINQIPELPTSAGLSTDRIKDSDTTTVPHMELLKKDVTIPDSAKFIQAESLNIFKKIERTNEPLLNKQTESENVKIITSLEDSSSKKSVNVEAKDTSEVHELVLTKPERFKRRARITFDTKGTLILKPDLVTNLKILDENKSINESFPIHTEKKLKTFPSAINKPQIYKPKLQLQNEYFAEPIKPTQSSVIVSQDIPEDSVKSSLIIAVSDLLQSNLPEGSDTLEKVQPSPIASHVEESTTQPLKENISEVVDSSTTKKPETLPYKLLVPKKRNILSDSSTASIKTIKHRSTEESNKVEQVKTIVTPEICKQEDKIPVIQKSNKPLSLKARWLLNSTKYDNQSEAIDSESNNLQTENKIELKTCNTKMDTTSTEAVTCNKPPIVPDIDSVLESTPVLEQSQNDDVNMTPPGKIVILDNIVMKNQSELCIPLIPNQEESVRPVTFNQDQINTVAKNVEENLETIIVNNKYSPPSKQRSKKKTDFTSIKSLSSPYMNTTDNTTDKAIDEAINEDNNQNLAEIAEKSITVESPSEVIDTVDPSVLHEDTDDKPTNDEPMESDNEKEIISTVESVPVDSSPAKTVSSVAEPSDLARDDKPQCTTTEPSAEECAVENQDVASHSNVATIPSPCSDLKDFEKDNKMDIRNIEIIETLSPEKDIEEFEAILKSVESGEDSCEYDKVNNTADILQDIVDMVDTDEENLANKSNSLKEDCTKLIVEDSNKNISVLSKEVLIKNENSAECESQVPIKAEAVESESRDEFATDEDKEKNPLKDFMEDPSSYVFEDTFFESMSELLDPAPFLDDLINFCDFEEICAIANDKLCVPFLKDRERDCMIGGVPLPTVKKNEIVPKGEISYLNELSPLVADELSNSALSTCVDMESVQPKIRSGIQENVEEESEVEEVESVHEISLCVRTQVRNSKNTSRSEQRISFTETRTERTTQEILDKSVNVKLLQLKNYDNSIIDMCGDLKQYIPKQLFTVLQKRYENNLVEVFKNVRKTIINSDEYLIDLNESAEQNQRASSTSNLPLENVYNEQMQIPFQALPVIAAPSNYNNVYVPHNQLQLAPSIPPLISNNAYIHQNQEMSLATVIAAPSSYVNVCNDQNQMPLASAIAAPLQYNNVYTEQNQIALATAMAAPSSYVNVCNDQNQLPLAPGIAAPSDYNSVYTEQNQIPFAANIAAPINYNQMPLAVGIAAAPSSYNNTYVQQNQHIPLATAAAPLGYNNGYIDQNQMRLATVIPAPSDYNYVYTGQNQIPLATGTLPLSYNNGYIQQNQGLQATAIAPLNYNGCTVYNQTPINAPSMCNNVDMAYNQTPILPSTYNNVCTTENIQKPGSLPPTDMELKRRNREQKKVSKEENQIKKSKCFETYKKLQLLSEKKKTQPVKVVTPLRNITPSRVPASKRKVALPHMQNNTIKQVQNPQVNDKDDKSQDSSLKIVPIKHVPSQGKSNRFKILDMPDLLSPPSIDVSSQMKSPENINVIHDSLPTKDSIPKEAVGTSAPVEMAEETQSQLPLATATLESNSVKNSSISETKKISFSDGNKTIEEAMVHSEVTVTDLVENNKSPRSQETQNIGDNITKPELKRKVAVLYNQTTNLLLNPVKEINKLEVDEEPVIKKPKLTNKVISGESSASPGTLSVNIKPSPKSSPKAKIDFSPRSDDHLTSELVREPQSKIEDIHTKEGDKQPNENGVQTKEDDLQTREVDIQTKEDGVQIKKDGIQIKEDGVQTKEEDIQIKKDGVQTKEENVQIKEDLRTKELDIHTKEEKSSDSNISKLEEPSNISTDLMSTSLPTSLPKNMSPREITQPVLHASSLDTKSPLPPLSQKKSSPSIENSEYVECEALPELKSPSSKLMYSKKTPPKAEPSKLVPHRSLPEPQSVLPIALPQKRSPTTLQTSENLDQGALPKLIPQLPETIHSKRTPSAVEPPELVLYCSLPDLKSPSSKPLLQKRTAPKIAQHQSTVRETSPEVKVQAQKHLPQKRPLSTNKYSGIKSPLQLPLSPKSPSSLNKRSKLTVSETTTEIKSTVQNPLPQKRTPPTTEGFERVVREFSPEFKSELQNQLSPKRPPPKLVVCGSTSEIKSAPQNPLSQRRTPPTMDASLCIGKPVVQESSQKQLLSKNSPPANQQPKLLIYGYASEVKLPPKVSLSQKRPSSIAANLNLTVHGPSPKMKSPIQHSLPIKTLPTTNEHQNITLLVTSQEMKVPLQKQVPLKRLPSSNEHQKLLSQSKTSHTAEYLEIAKSSASPEIKQLPPIKRSPPTNEPLKNAVPRVSPEIKSPLQMPLPQRRTPPTPADLELARSRASSEIKKPLLKQVPPKRSPPTNEHMKNVVVTRISPEMKSPLQIPLPQRKTPPTSEGLELARSSVSPEIKQVPQKRSPPSNEPLKNVLVTRISPEIKSPLQMPLSQRKTPPSPADLELARSSASPEIKLPLLKQLPPKRSPPTNEPLKNVLMTRISPEIKSPLQMPLSQRKTPPTSEGLELAKSSASPEIKLQIQKQLPPPNEHLKNALPRVSPEIKSSEVELQLQKQAPPKRSPPTNEHMKNVVTRISPEMKSPLHRLLPQKKTPPTVADVGRGAASPEIKLPLQNQLPQKRSLLIHSLTEMKAPVEKPLMKRTPPTIEPPESIRPLPKMAHPQQKLLPENRVMHMPVISKPVMRFVPKPVPVKTSPPRFSQVYEPTLKPIIADPPFDRYPRESARSCYSSSKETVHTAAMSHITHVSRTTGVSQTTHVSRTTTQEHTSRKREHAEDYDMPAKKSKADELFDFVKNSKNPTFTSFRSQSSSLTSSLASSSKVDYYRFTEETGNTSPLRNRKQQNIPFRATTNRTSTSASISARASTSTSTRFGDTLHQQSRSIDVNASRRKEEGGGRYMDSFSLSARTTTTSKTFSDRSGKPPVVESPRWDSWDLPNDFSNQAVLEALRNSRHSDDHRKKERKPVYVSDFLRNQSR